MRVTLHFPHLKAQLGILSEKLIPVDKRKAFKHTRISRLKTWAMNSIHRWTTLQFLTHVPLLYVKQCCIFPISTITTILQSYFKGFPYKVFNGNSSATAKLVSLINLNPKTSPSLAQKSLNRRHLSAICTVSPKHRPYSPPLPLLNVAPRCCHLLLSSFSCNIFALATAAIFVPAYI